MGRRGAASPTDRSHHDNWRGGFYELSIKLGEHDDERLDTAVRVLWDAAGLSGAFRRRPRVSVQVSGASLLVGSLHSVARIPGLGSTLCSVMVGREETRETGATRFGADWLDLCLPMGALGNLDRRVGAFPFDNLAGDPTGRAFVSHEWQEPIERWFDAIAGAVFTSVPFAHAVTGFEVSGLEPADGETGGIGVLLPARAGGLKRSTW